MKSVFTLKILRFYSVVSSKKIEKILIANRGEIACRVMRTGRKLGIKTVAVYSEVDANALHVRMADESICIGPAQSSLSYLNIPEIIKAVKVTGAQAVHPGYGFLSENFKFCEELEKAGVEFIGPSFRSIHLMGDKIESKKIAKAAGVHTIPGFEGVIEDLETCKKVANEIGYPVMIKASAGGGGKGMRIAWNDEEVVENFKIAGDESRNSFGDDRLFIEKFIEQPRHIEIQLIGDKHGNIVYLPERECSIQRRNQKVIEEAPSTAINPETRRKMGEQAVKLAKKVGYFSAGTVEFLVDVKNNFYFLEMNTRLQVEHPITEYITGLDLVELMIRVAEGKPLPFKQEDVKLTGWSIECRVYAEDPKLYLPSIGRLNFYKEPDKSNGRVRCDTGIIEGSEISIYYDPLICKLSTFGKDRSEALEEMKRALDSYVIRGVTHNIPLLREVINNKKFIEGSKISTKFLTEEFPDGGFNGHVLTENERIILLGLGMFVHKMKYGIVDKDLELHVKIGDGEFFKVSESGKANANTLKDTKSFIINGDKEMILKNFKWNLIDPLIKFNSSFSDYYVELVEKKDLGFEFRMSGTVYSVTVLSPLEFKYQKYMKISAKSDLSTFLISPMPGQIISLPVTEGQIVQANTPLVTLEAMKMQNVLKADRTAKIIKIFVEDGMKVGAEEKLMEFEFL